MSACNVQVPPECVTCSAASTLSAASRKRELASQQMDDRIKEALLEEADELAREALKSLERTALLPLAM